jgi:ribose transport system ATP-binding protein
MAPFAQLAQIDKRFEAVHALEGVDFEIAPGEIVGLIGANGAGKSTLMRILAGEERADHGTIAIKGEEVRFSSPRQALERGIARMPQELTLVEGHSVEENILLGRLTAAGGVVRWGKVRARVQTLLKRVGLAATVDTGQPIETLTPVQQRLVTLAQALAKDPGLLILDEPTAALPIDAAERLFPIVRQLAADGVAIVYISHRLEEVVRLCDRVVAMRDGKVAGTLAPDELDVGAMVVLVGGRALAEEPERMAAHRTRGKPVMRASGLGGIRVRDLDLELQPGELVGIGGLQGSGRSELLRLLAGAQPATAGTLEVLGGSAPRTLRESVARGVGYLPEGRSRTLFQDLSVSTNTSIASVGRLRRLWLLLDGRAERIAVQRISGRVGLVGRLDAPVSTLSGGNQQKVCLARWMMRGCEVMLLDEPSAGVDVHVRAEIHQLLRRSTAEGMTVVVASAEPEELALLCDRVIVLAEGRINRELSSPFTADSVVAASYAG